MDRIVVVDPLQDRADRREPLAGGADVGQRIGHKAGGRTCTPLRAWLPAPLVGEMAVRPRPTAGISRIGREPPAGPLGPA